MLDRLTERSRQVVDLAEHEAARRHDGAIGTEHLLLGLLSVGGGVAPLVLEPVGVSYSAAEAVLSRRDRPEREELPGSPPFSPRAKAALDLAQREALLLGHAHVGTEHLLLGLLREGAGTAAEILVELGAKPSELRDQVLEVMAPPRTRAEFGRLHATGALIRVIEIAGRGPVQYEIGYSALEEWLLAYGRSGDDLQPDDVVVESVGGGDQAGLRFSVMRYFLEREQV